MAILHLDFPPISRNDCPLEWQKSCHIAMFMIDRWSTSALLTPTQTMTHLANNCNVFLHRRCASLQHSGPHVGNMLHAPSQHKCVIMRPFGHFGERKKVIKAGVKDAVCGRPIGIGFSNLCAEAVGTCYTCFKNLILSHVLLPAYEVNSIRLVFLWLFSFFPERMIAGRNNYTA